MKVKNVLSMAVILLMSYVSVSQQSESEPSYRIQETHTLESPITKKELENWDTKKSAILLKNNIVLSPEIVSAKGAIINKQIVPYSKDWIVDIKVTIGNEKKSAKGGAGMAFFYVEDIDQNEIGSGLFGYSRQFKGVQVSLNSLFSEGSDEEAKNLLQLFTNDGT
jgi:hypothetical protein